jgi:GntR family transcriptional regulator, transcriptional repressor for pyruvate dehydrogenase complex
MLDLVERQNVSELVADKIKQLIFENGLESGDRLPTEHELAERFGVSRISLREATKALGFLGILDAKPGRGLVVGEVDMKQVSKYLGFHLTINKYPAQELVETRVVIETGALSHTMSRMDEDPSIYIELNNIVKKLHNVRSLKKWIELDMAFHRLLLSSSGLKPLLAFNDLLDIFFEQFRENVKKGDWKSGNECHQRIIDALRNRDLGTACSELNSHIRHHID